NSFAVDVLWQAERHWLEIKLDQGENAHRIHLNDKLRNSAFETPFHQGRSKCIGNRIGKSPAGAMARRHTMARDFPDVRPHWALNLAKLRHNFGKQVRAG